MNQIPCPPIPPVPGAPPADLAAVKARQQATWSSGDFAIIGTTLQIVGEMLCEAVDLRAGQTVLDVACGNGNAALAAARRFGRVTGLDYVPHLLERAGARAAAEGAQLELVEGDAERLPFPDGRFEVVLSTFGVMFTADQDAAARELARVCAPGGTIGLANWTPEGMIGQLFQVIGRHVPPPAGVRSPALWGTEARLQELFGAACGPARVERRSFMFRYASPAHCLDVFRRYYGPVLRAFAALDEAGRAALEQDFLALFARCNRSGDGTLVAPAEYLEVVLERR